MVSLHPLRLDLTLVLTRRPGPVILLRVYGRKRIILNTHTAVMDLLEARSSIYSDRPFMWMYSELMGRKLAVFNISSGHPRFKKYRKLLHSGLNPRAVQDYRPLLERETAVLLRGLHKEPSKFISHIRR